MVRFLIQVLFQEFDLITNTVNSGNPLVICIPAHAMNVCNIKQDIDNPSLFYIYVWDNETMSEVSYRDAVVK